MSEWIRSILDLLLIVMVGAGLVQAMRLIKHLTGLRQGRVEMEHFVREFNATVLRAEAGIKNLRSAARESGDDLEKLVEKSALVRDELQLILGSAEGVAERLSAVTTTAMQAETKPATKAVMPKTPPKATEPEPAVAPPPAPETASPASGQKGGVPSSRAEKELLQALQKLS